MRRSTRAILAAVLVVAAAAIYAVALLATGKLTAAESVVGPLFGANVGLIFTMAFWAVILVVIVRGVLGASWLVTVIVLAVPALGVLGAGVRDVAVRLSESDPDPALAELIRGKLDTLVVLDVSDAGARAALQDPAVRAMLVRDGPPIPDVASWDLAFGVAIADGTRVWLLEPMSTPDEARHAVSRLLSGMLPHSSRVPAPTPRLVDEPRVGWRPNAARTVARVVLPGRGRYSLDGCDGSRAEARVVVVVSDSEPAACAPTEATVVTGLGRDVFDTASDVLTGQPSSWGSLVAFEYRPFLYFDSAEFYRPLDVDQLLTEADRDGRAIHEICDERVLWPNDCAPLESATRLADLPDHINLSGDLRYGRDARASTDLIEAARAPLPPSSPQPPTPGAPPGPPPPGVVPPGIGHGPGGGSFCAPTPDDRECDGGPWSRMYFHIVPDGDFLHIDYWWYFRFNVSPVKTSAMCLSALSITERSCFDHESDWEGVTVTIPVAGLRGRSLPLPESVTYSGHDWRFKFDWPTLESRWKALETRDYGLDTGRHARVYVAFGSHASYPLPCDASDPDPLESDLGCWQGDHRRDLFWRISIPLPDGRRDGEAPWSMNIDETCFICLAPVPKTRNGDAARWNAYPGTWGKGECALGVTKLCVRSNGPRSPSLQDRYIEPGGAPSGTGLARAGVGG